MSDWALEWAAISASSIFSSNYFFRRRTLPVVDGPVRSIVVVARVFLVSDIAGASLMYMDLTYAEGISDFIMWLKIQEIGNFCITQVQKYCY